MIYKISHVSRPGLHLAAYADPSRLKVYLLDVGLLGAMSNLSASTLMEGNSIFTLFHGSLVENRVVQQSRAN